jgi:ABC-type Mn2+/Zn2+ transport system permease subunit
MGYPWRGRPHRWVLLISGVVGFIGLLGGIVSGHAEITIGGVIWLVVTSAYLIFYVKSEHR